jgi:hypothetical protein
MEEGAVSTGRNNAVQFRINLDQLGEKDLNCRNTYT